MSKTKVMTTKHKQKIIKQFCKQYAWLKVVLDEYQVLFEGNQARCRLLNEVAQNFFGNLNYILVHYILLSMCKLTDPAHSMKKDNITVKYILKLVGEEDRKKLGLDELSKNIHSIGPYIREARNKVIAHHDKNTLLLQKTVGEIPKSVLDSFWDSLQKFVNKVHEYYCGQIVGDVVNLTGARDLVEALKKAVHFDDYFRDKDLLALDEMQKMRYKNA